MEYASVSTEFNCGVDLHARTMYVTVAKGIQRTMLGESGDRSVADYILMLKSTRNRFPS